MSEELLLDLPDSGAQPAKAKKKPAVKKAAPKKEAAPKKVAAKKTAKPAPELPAEAAPAAAAEGAPAAEAKPVAKPRAPRKTAASKSPEPPVPAAEPAPAPPPAVTAAEPVSTAPTPAAAEPAPAPAAAAPEARAQAPEAAPPQERRKTKFERWKERRERFRQEKLARQQAQGGGQQGQSSHHHQPRAPRDHAQNGEDERNRTPEVPLGPPEAAEGVLELTPKGYGFLRQRERNFAQHPNDSFISADFIRQYGLREGVLIKGVAQKGSRGLQITSVSEVNGRVPESIRDLPLFEELKAVNPNKRIQFETTKDRLTTRVIDMFTPVGRGQRGLIVAPPRAGKTTLLQHIAEAVMENHPQMHLMLLLVDERPEEVTELKRGLPRAEIYASSNDQDVKSHTRIAAFAVERAKRLVEAGEHVFMLMDSITRLARAFNNAKSGGATMSGGMGVGAMEIPRRLFAAARNTRTAGSLTILATALIETGSRMDDLIFQEFKGTGNMELVLDRKIAEQFYYPAVNIFKSGTRREELLLQAFQLDKIHMLRRGLAGHKPIDAIQRVLSLMERYPSNAQMLVDLPNKGG